MTRPALAFPDGFSDFARMVPSLPRPAARGLKLTAFVLRALLLTVSGLRAAEVVEMETDLHGIVGQLKGEARQLTPEITPASDEGRLALTRMQLPPGLQAALWAAEPMLVNPVAFNFDERGRIFVAETNRYGTSVLDIRDYMWTLEDDLANRNQTDFLASIHRNFGAANVKELAKESERISLLEDTNGDGVADKASIYADNFRSPLDGIASGVLARRGEVWFTNIPALWHLTGRDQADTRTELHRGYGVRFNFTGHDLHGLIFGPDGRIYYSIGDRGASVTTQEGTVISAPDTGSVFRCYPDGSHLELFATGLRNPQSLLFTENGDLFTGDNDSDQGDQERLVHVVENGDSGWRVGYQHAPQGHAGPWNAERLWRPRHPSQPAYLLPPICNIEDGPSGIAYYPGTGLNSDYAGRIFITHFKGSIPRSGIDTYKLKPAGASYAIEDAAPFLTNALPTDVRFGPDGRLYYSDWAEGWPKSKRGRIYAMFDSAHVHDPRVKQTQQLIASDYTKKTNDELAGLLAHPDWRVRLEAQYSLVERGGKSILVFNGVLAHTAGPPLARRHAAWGLGQLAARYPGALKALRPLLQSDDDEVRAQTAKLLGDHHDAAMAGELVAALNDRSARVKFFAAQSLGKLQHAAAASALLTAVRTNRDTDAYLRHALVLGLVGCATPAQLAESAKDDSRAVRLAAVLALRRLSSPEIARFLTDPDPLIVREAAAAINDAPIPAAFPALAAFVDHPVANEATMLRALNARFRLGTASDAAVLAAYAARLEAPAALRTEALTLLTLWPNPPARDRLVGTYRPLAEKTRPAAEVVAAFSPYLAGLLSGHTPESIQSAAIGAVMALKISSASPALLALVAEAATPAEIRIAALRALDALGAAQLPAALAAALAAKEAELRLAALPLTTRLAPETAIATLAKLLEPGTPLEQRAVFKILGDAPQAEADEIILAQLARLTTGQVAPSAQLELLEAAARRADPRIKQALADRDTILAKDPDPIAAFRVALEGGNANAGRKLFNNHPVMQCSRCHRDSDEPGGEAGPNLAGVGARESRESILQSIVKPSAKFAAGFELATLTKKNGDVLVGTIVQRNETSVRLRTGATDPIEVAQADITSLVSAPSAMPELATLVMTKAEIRDLVAAVAALRTPPGQMESTGPRALVAPPID